MLAFVAGLLLSLLIVLLVGRNILRTRLKAERDRAESAANVEKVRLETELAHACSRLDDEEKRHCADVQQLEQRYSQEKQQLEQRCSQEKQQLEQRYSQEKQQLEQRHGQEIQQQEQRHAQDLKQLEQRNQENIKTLQERFDETVSKMSEQLKNKTDDMLKQRQKEFNEMSSNSLGQIVNPLKENIEQLKKTMEQDNKDQAQRDGEIKERIKNLMEQSEAARKSADELSAALRHGSKVQGDWGETVLDELLSSQGLTPGVHYDTQATLRNADGSAVRNTDGSIMRPDVILHLDESRELIIDSKVSISAYVDYVNAENEEDRARFLKAHIDSIKKHVAELSKKDYSSYVKAPKVSAGYVIMFVPNSGALWTALHAEPDLWRKAADAQVYIADEQSLYAALKIVNLTWRQVAQAQNHEKVYELAAEMIERVGIFVEKYESVGKYLKKAQDEFDDGMKKLDVKGQSIVNSANKLMKLGAKNSVRHPLPELDEGSAEPLS